MYTNLRSLRIARGWTLEETASKLNITKGAYFNIEVGNRKPSYEILIKLLNLFEYNDPRELFAEVPDNLTHHKSTTKKSNPQGKIKKG